MKNEVVQTSAPHKMAGNYFSAQKNVLPTSYACFFYQKHFQTSMTSRSAGLRKNMRNPPLSAGFGIRFFSPCDKRFNPDED